jgi:hypothetical protein
MSKTPQEEIAELKELVAKYQKIILHASPDKFEGVYFICGQMGGTDGMGLPEHITVCPAYGLDGFAVYTKTRDYTAPGW